MSPEREALLARIETDHICPPIPIRDCDWRANFIDYGDETGPFGYGPTQAAAIDNLIDLYEAAEDEAAERAERATTFSVVAVDLTNHGERILAHGKSRRDAEAIVEMAVLRRGVDREFFKVRPEERNHG